MQYCKNHKLSFSANFCPECTYQQESKMMNPRKFFRTMDQAFPFGPEYGCAIEKPRKSEVIADYLLAIVIGLLIAFGLVKYFS